MSLLHATLGKQHHSLHVWKHTCLLCRHADYAIRSRIHLISLFSFILSPTRVLKGFYYPKVSRGFYEGVKEVLLSEGFKGVFYEGIKGVL